MTAEAQFQIVDEHDFKWWRLQDPLAAEILKEIIYRFRRSSARAWGKPGKWAAYPHRTWRIWLGNISESRFERRLKKLVDFGLIERERHRFGGTAVCAFLRPTPLALKFMGKPSDMALLQGPVKYPKTASDGVSEGKGDGTSDGIGDGTDHTSFPFHSNYSSYSQKAPASLGEEGKGKAHTKEIQKKSLVKPAAVGGAEPNELPDGGDVELLAKLKAIKTSHKLDKDAKRTALLQLLPPIPGAAAASVLHPSDMHKGKWHGWSPELHLKRYAKYREYAQNALNKTTKEKGNTALKLLTVSHTEYDAEMAKLDAELAAAMAKLDCVN